MTCASGGGARCRMLERACAVGAPIRLCRFDLLFQERIQMVQLLTLSIGSFLAFTAGFMVGGYLRSVGVVQVFRRDDTAVCFQARVARIRSAPNVR